MSGWAAAVGAATDLIGSWIGAEESRKRAHESNTMQYDFAQNGLKMRVEDAKAAGIHPLAALGAQLPSASPAVAVGGVGDTVSRFGQNISRAAAATMTAEERAEYDLKLQLLRSQISETDARAGYYNSQAAKIDTPQVGAPMPGQVKPVAPDQYSRSKDDSSRVASDNPVWQKTEIAPGVFMDLPYSQGESPFESMEGFLPQLLTAWKNFWYNPKQDVKNWAEKHFPIYFQLNRAYRRTMRPFKNTYR